MIDRPNALFARRDRWKRWSRRPHICSDGPAVALRRCLMSALAAVGRIIRMIARPEYMTAYATVAAAAAAFLSWQAAEQQEKAIFTSNLYNKQVDTVASFL
jgi:hypothetical protein